jgi:hypothetical protein
MNAAFWTPRHAVASPRPTATDTPCGSLQLHQIFAHVAQREARRGTGGLLARLLELVDACAQLSAARHGLTQALDVQEQIERLVELAQGREHAQCLSSEERAALEAPRAQAQRGAATALARWRAAAQRFTQLTGLLPTQLPHDLAWPAAFKAASHVGLQACALGEAADLQACVVRSRDRWTLSQCRCERADREVRSASAERFKALLDWRTGQGSLSALAQACLAEWAARGALLQAEAERAAAHCTLGLLCAEPAPAG